jgi:hypothetical protein
MDENRKNIDFQYEEEQRGLSAVAKIGIALAFLAVVLFVFLLWPVIGFGQERDMRMENTGVGVTYGFDAGAAFHSYNSRNFFFVSRDGVSLIGSNDTQVWNEAFVLNRPVVHARGAYLAVGERDRAMLLTVLSEETGGISYSVSLENPALSFSVNETGFLSAIVLYEWRYMAYVFDHRHTAAYAPFFGLPILFADGLMMPVSLEVSHDGRFAAAAIVDLGIHVNTILEFHHTRHSDVRDPGVSLFGAREFPEQFITHRRFVSDNQLVVATTAGIYSFRMGPGHGQWSEMWNIPLTNEMGQIEFLGATYFAVALGDRKLGVEDSHPVGTVQIFNVSNGTPHGSFFMGRRVSYMSAGRGAFIIGAERNFQAINPRGDTLWDFTTMHDTHSVIFVDDTNTILVAGTTRADIHRRRRATPDEPVIEGTFQ